MILPVNYLVPPEIASKLATGELVRFGSVVRDSKEIVLHLKEVQIPSAEEGLVAAAKAVISKNPKVSVGVGLALVAAGSAYVWSAKKRKRNSVIDPEVPASVSALKEALAKYLEALQSGSLDAEIVNRLVSALDTVGEDADSGNLTIELSTEQLSALVDLVADYTRELADANGIMRINSGDSIESPAVAPIGELRRRLQYQQRVFNEAA